MTWQAQNVFLVTLSKWRHHITLASVVVYSPLCEEQLRAGSIKEDTTSCSADWLLWKVPQKWSQGKMPTKRWI